MTSKPSASSSRARATSFALISSIALTCRRLHLSLEQRDRALLPVRHLAVQRRGLRRLRQRFVERREQHLRITIKILVSDRHCILVQELSECCGHRSGRRHFRAAHQAGNKERAAIEDGGDLAAHEVVGTGQSVQGAEPAFAHNDHTRRALRQRGVQHGDEILSRLDALEIAEHACGAELLGERLGEQQGVGVVVAATVTDEYPSHA